MSEPKLEKFRAFVLSHISKSKSGTRSTVGLVGKTAQKKTGVDLFTAEVELYSMRKEGLIYCTNGKWWLPR